MPWSSFLGLAIYSAPAPLYAHYVTFVSAESFTIELTIYLLAMVILVTIAALIIFSAPKLNRSSLIGIRPAVISIS